MNDKSFTAQATVERRPAPPEIQGRRSRAGCSPPPARGERSRAQSGGGGGSDRGPRNRDAATVAETIRLDVPAIAAALSQRLYAAGVPVTPERAVSFAQALTLVSPMSRRYLYCTARAVFVSSPAHLPVFDRVFAAVFEADEDPHQAHDASDRRRKT
jgi:hypothetical protein